MGYKDDKRAFSKPDAADVVKIGSSLGDDTSMWLESIKGEFKKEYPEITAKSTPHFAFTNKDFSEGAGTGSITVTVGDRILLFPIIIRDKDLAPFDTFYDQNDKSWHYMTDEAYKSLSNVHSPYKGLSKDDLSEYDNVDTRSGINHVEWRDPSKLAQLDFSRLEKLAEYFISNASELMHAPQPYIDAMKVATSLLNEQRKMASMEKNASDMGYVHGKYDSYDVALVRRADVDEYSVKLGSYGDREVEELSLSSFGIQKLAAEFGKLSAKVLEDADRGEGALVTRGHEIPTRIIDNRLTDYITTKPGMIRTFGTYEVVLSDGNKETGVAYPMLDWDGDDTGKLLFAGNSAYSVTKPFSGRLMSDHMVLPKGNISQGVKGFFVKNSEGQAYCTKPIQIDSIDSDEVYPLHIYATDLSDMSHIHLVFTKAYGRPTRINPDTATELIDHSGGNYYIPHNMRFTPLPERQVDIMSSEESGMKVASDKRRTQHQGSIVEVTKTASKYTVYQKESVLSKGKGIRDFESADLAKTAFLLSVFGCAPDMVDLSKMATGESAELFIPMDAILSRRITDSTSAADEIKTASVDKMFIEKFAQNIEPLIPSVFDVAKIAMVLARIDVDKYMPLVTRAAQADVSIVKEAEEGGGDSLNKIFNLNFLSKENVGYFIEHLPALEAVEDVLTRLLIVSRIGDIGIDPGMVEATLEGVAEIMERFAKAEVIAKGR